MKVVVNKCYGGFGLSVKALMKLIEMKSDIIEKTTVQHYYCGSDDYKKRNAPCYNPNWKEKFEKDSKDKKSDVGNGFYTFGWGETLTDDKFIYDIDIYRLDRSNKDLITVIEDMGEEVNGNHAELKVIEIPDGVEYEIDEYDGIESIHEVHRSW